MCTAPRACAGGGWEGRGRQDAAQADGALQVRQLQPSLQPSRRRGGRSRPAPLTSAAPCRCGPLQLPPPFLQSGQGWGTREGHSPLGKRRRANSGSARVRGGASLFLPDSVSASKLRVPATCVATAKSVRTARALVPDIGAIVGRVPHTRSREWVLVGGPAKDDMFFGGRVKRSSGEIASPSSQCSFSAFPVSCISKFRLCEAPFTAGRLYKVALKRRAGRQALLPLPRAGTASAVARAAAPPPPPAPPSLIQQTCQLVRDGLFHAI